MQSRYEVATIRTSAGCCFDGPAVYKILWYPRLAMVVSTNGMIAINLPLFPSSGSEDINLAFDDCCRFIREEISRRGRQVEQIVVSENWDYSLCPAIYDFGLPVEHPETDDLRLAWEDTH